MTQKISSTNIETSTLISLNGPTIANVSIANSTYVILDDTAVSNAGGYAVITGSNFVSGAQVLFGNTAAPAVSFVNSTTLNVQVPALTAGSYVMYIQNPDGSTAIKLNAITSSPIPVWVTGSTLTTQTANTPISISLSAPSDSNVSFSVANGSSLPSGTTLASNGLFSGTISTSTETTYNFSVNAIDTENQEALRSFSVTVQVSDQYFANTVLLLNGETTGANSSNTWLQDISTNKFELTVNGDTRPVGFSPYETVWSNFFDGTDDYLTITANNAFNLPGDFTMECWAYWNALGSNSMLIDTYVGGDNGSYQLYWRSTGSSIAFYTPGDGVILQDPSSSTISTNRWHHIAVSRSGTTARLFVDGVQRASATLTRDLTHDNSFSIGIQLATSTNDINGYISNLRLVKGTGLYTSNFTPSTTPLTAIANTVLLTCQSNRFIDNSTNNFSITVGNNTSISNFGPFVETDLITGSAYFDGTGDDLSIATNTAFADLSGDFTIECWFYTGSTSVMALAGTAVFNSSGYFIELNYSGAGRVSFLPAPFGNRLETASSVYSTNTWNHVAIVRSGTTVTIYMNGTSVVSGTRSVTTNTQPLTIGQAGNGWDARYYFNGYISNFRVVKGTAVYTSNFTPPTTPLTAVANTSLLTLQNRLGENSNRFIDESGLNHIITRNGNATQGTFTPFSPTGWSNYFNSSNTDHLILPFNSVNVAANNFALEAWVQISDRAAFYTIFNSQTNASTASGSSYGLSITQTNGYLESNWYVGSGLYTLTSTNAVPLNVWNHVALVRTGNTMSIYLNGVRQATRSDMGTNTINAGSESYQPYIGRNGAYYPMKGYISDFRIIIGSHPHDATSSTLTVPTSRLTAVTNTVILTCNSNRFIDTNTQVSAKTITTSGSPSVQAFNPFAPTATYSAATVGGSGYFDGTADNLTVSTNSTSSVGSGSFYFEAWVYLTNPSANQMIIADPSSTGGLFVGLNIDGSSRFTIGRTAVGVDNLVTVTWVGNQWYHLAVNRNGTSLQFFVNGTQVGSTGTNSINYPSVGYRVGAEQAAGSAALSGYISGLRLVKSSVNTTNFTPPTAPPDTTSAALCLKFTNSGVIDYTSKNVLESVGNVRVSTAQTQYGSRSLYFDGTGDWLLLPASPNMAMGTGDLTFECWIYATAASDQPIYECRSTGSNTDGFTVTAFSSTVIRVYTNGVLVTATISNYLNTWTHVAFTRSGNTNRLFINGVLQNTYTALDNFTNTVAVVGGGRYGSNNIDRSFTGYIDDLRITKGVARYTANFTPPGTLLTR